MENAKANNFLRSRNSCNFEACGNVANTKTTMQGENGEINL